MTSNAKAEGCFGKQDFRYLTDENVHICPAAERLAFSFTTEENGLVLHRYATKACQTCAIKTALHHRQGATGHALGSAHILEAVQKRLDARPEKMRQRREEYRAQREAIRTRESGVEVS